jgi:hypothetical protein
VPVIRLSKEKKPSEFVLVLQLIPVCEFVKTVSTSGRFAPVGSWTVPEREQETF